MSSSDQPPASGFWNQPFSIQWRKALVSVPRAVPDVVLRYTSPEGPQPIVFSIPSHGKHQIPLYVFVPDQVKPARGDTTTTTNTAPKTPTKLPVLVDFHGGGFILGSCQEQAPFCAKMARELNCIVITVDYRLGPVDQYPAANEDADDVIKAIVNPSAPGYKELRKAIREKRSNVELDPNKLAFSGFSSGGNLALCVAQSIQNDPTIHKPWPSPIPASIPNKVPLLLFYPSLDCRLLPSERPRPPGMEAPKGFLEGLRLESELMPRYLPKDQRGHPRASPGLVDLNDNTLHPQARMFLVLPEMDTLAHQSGVWVDKVKAEGYGDRLVVEKVKGVVHGWTQFPDSWLTEDDRLLKRDVFDKARDFVREQWR